MKNSLKYSTIIIFLTSIFLLTVCESCTTNDKQTVSAQWERIGPGGGGATFFPTFSYADTSTFIVRCDMTGSYLTKDGGKSYQQINFTGAASSFAFDPNDKNSIYIATSELNRSNDGGVTWERIFPLKQDIKNEQFIGDHADYEIETFDSTIYSGGKSIKSVTVDPFDSNTIYFALGSNFFYTNDTGKSWSKVNISENIDYLYTNTDKLKNEVYIFSGTSIYIFDKTKKSTSKIDLPELMSPAYSFSAGKVKGEESVIFYTLHKLEQKDDPFAFASCEVWSSSDYGISWKKVDHPAITNISSGITPSFVSVRCSEFDASRAYLVCNNYEERINNENPKIWYGAFKTSDGGKSWEWVWKAGGGSSQYGVKDASDAPNIKDAWVQKAFGNEFIQLMDVGVSPTDGNVASVTDWYRTMKTTDGGNTWNEIYSAVNPDGTYSSRGLDVTTAYKVHFDPFDRNHIAVSYTDIGYFHSYDEGKTWSRSVEGVPISWVNTCYDIVFDSDIEGKLWSAWSRIHDFPRGKMTRNPNWRNSRASSGGVCLSLDGGKTWSPQTQGMGEDALITSLLIDKRSKPEERTIYVTAYNKGVYKSTDDGKTWSLKNNGLTENSCAFQITQAVNGDLYLVVSMTPSHNYEEGSKLYYSGDVYKSTDNAETWTKLNVVEGDIFPNEITTDPLDPNILYLACWSKIQLADLVGGNIARKLGGNFTINTPGGIFKSVDGGENWTSIFDKNQYVYGVMIDTNNPGRMYCNTFNKAAYRSDDYGQTWSKIKGYDFHWGHRVIVDQNNIEKVYITTFGSSIWHGYPEI